MNCPTCGLNIDEHPANRCLDAWVAEEVMGLNVVSRNWPCGHTPDCGGYEASMQAEARYSWYTEKDPVYWEDVNSDGWGWPPWVDEDHGDLIACIEPVPFYSTDIAAAWSVVEKLGELADRDILVEYCADGDRMCTIGRHYRGLWMKDVQAVAATIPLAICRVALKAMGIEL